MIVAPNDCKDRLHQHLALRQPF
uniref:Uncharacterized protein n=1 Tax=Anguilla anguilla TaxID=7936 RepID=A0A0E9ULT7_ANGAN